MIAALLSFYMRTNSTKELINKLYETSKTIISSQDDKDKFKTDFILIVLENINYHLQVLM